MTLNVRFSQFVGVLLHERINTTPVAVDAVG